MYQIGTLKVSRIGLGGTIFGHYTDERETFNIFEEAKNNGINFVDTASTYNDGVSEELIGKCIKEDRDYWVISTKIGIEDEENCSGHGKREKIISSCESSLKRLQIETIDLYQMHNYDSDTPLDETLGTLQELQQQGKIKEFGVSNYTINQLFELRNAINEFPNLKCASLQTPYNAFARNAEDRLIPFCMKERMAVLPYNVLAQGILTEKYLNKNIPEGSRAQISENIRRGLVPEVIGKIKSLKEIADHNEITLSQLIISWTLSQRGIAAIPLGMSNPEQVKDNCKAIEINLSERAFNQIDDIISNVNDLSQYTLISKIAESTPNKVII